MADTPASTSSSSSSKEEEKELSAQILESEADVEKYLVAKAVRALNAPFHFTTIKEILQMLLLEMCRHEDTKKELRRYVELFEGAIANQKQAIASLKNE